MKRMEHKMEATIAYWGYIGVEPETSAHVLRAHGNIIPLEGLVSLQGSITV